MSKLRINCKNGIWYASCMWRNERIESSGDSISLALMGLQVCMSDEIVLEGGIDV